MGLGLAYAGSQKEEVTNFVLLFFYIFGLRCLMEIQESSTSVSNLLDVSLGFDLGG